MSNLKRGDITKLATAAGIKNVHRGYKTSELCEMLNIPYKPGRRNMTTPYLVKNLCTGVEIEYPSGYKAMKALNADPNIYKYAKTQKPVTIRGVQYVLTKLKTE